jgi:hypothetical protein
VHRFIRVLPVAALLTATPLFACSGDDDEDDTPVTSTPITTATPEGTGTTPEGPDDTAPVTSGNDSSVTSGADNGTGDNGTGGDEDEGTEESAPGVATTTG